MARLAAVELCVAALLLLLLAALSGGAAAQQGVGSIITRSVFDDMLKQRNNPACPAKGFYTYDAFIAAAKTFPAFGNTGDMATRKRELAAFFGETSHETTGQQLLNQHASEQEYKSVLEENKHDRCAKRRSCLYLYVQEEQEALPTSSSGVTASRKNSPRRILPSMDEDLFS